MMVHPSAILHPSVQLPSQCNIGAFSQIDSDVEMGSGCEIGTHCRIFSGTRLGENVRIHQGAVVGGPPQDLKYAGEETQTLIGDGTILREYTTINRGTIANGFTAIGKNCLIMAYTHVAHDCVIGDGVIISNGVQMGGHVCVHDLAVISGMTGVHQFTTIGKGSFIGGGLRVAKDIIPYTRALGEPLSFAGVNAHGLKKAGYSEVVIKSYGQFVRKMRNKAVKEWVEHLQSLVTDDDPGIWRDLVSFFDKSARAVLLR